MLQFLPLIGTVIDKIFPDPEQAANAKLEMMKLEQDGAFKEMDNQLKRDLEQIALNKIEAGSDDKFKSRWRPAVGWICAFGLAYATLIFPFLTWLSLIMEWPVPPQLDTGILLTALGGILGIGGMRSYEKKSGLTK